MTLSNQEILQNLPSVDSVTNDPDLESCTNELGRAVLVNTIRRAIDEVRELLLTQALVDTDEDAIRRKIIVDVKKSLKNISTPHYRKVINATGIILHTALGRAVLSARALRQIQEELSGYSLLQTDTETGKRSKRDGCVEQLFFDLGSSH